MPNCNRLLTFAKILPALSGVLIFTSAAIASPTCSNPVGEQATDSSAAKTLYWGLTNNNSTCSQATGMDVLAITFPFKLDPSVANGTNFSFWNASQSIWSPVECAQWGPTSGMDPELTTVTVFLSSGNAPKAGDTLKICHAELAKLGGGTTPSGYITSKGWCDQAGTPVKGQGIGIVSAFDNRNEGVCTDGSQGIMLILSGGARNSRDRAWTLADIRNKIHVTVSGSTTSLSPVKAVGDADKPVADNYYEICVNYPDKKSFADVTKITMANATAYDPHGCVNEGKKSWTP